MDMLFWNSLYLLGVVAIWAVILCILYVTVIGLRNLRAGVPPEPSRHPKPMGGRNVAAVWIAETTPWHLDDAGLVVDQVIAAAKRGAPAILVQDALSGVLK